MTSVRAESASPLQTYTPHQRLFPSIPVGSALWVSRWTWVVDNTPAGGLLTATDLACPARAHGRSYVDSVSNLGSSDTEAEPLPPGYRDPTTFL
ncbi:hypothetical protein AVEN_6026-1 [Araneus ventricosus]|uniref:Uncharacterized protein n=1 Tax=Araneus ventricosus TaxID=182803 RepID=A0A4Y2HRT7_ARAVE|nr:hypothetical protein AVEN_6026-1 [Araneus ventricosus]